MPLDSARIEELSARVQREIDDGLLPSCQIAVGLDGEVVHAEAFGDVTNDTRYAIFSCTKALIAAVMWQLIAEGRVRPGDTVASHFPEFAANNKGAITIEQVMTHTSGFPRAPLGPPKWSDRQWRIDKMSSWRVNWEPGTRFEYHPTSAHWVLGEIIERLDGRDYRESVRARVLEPLGLQRLTLGVEAGQQRDIADLAIVGEEPSADELEAAFGLRTFDRGEVTPALLLGFNDSGARAAGIPGGGAISNAADVALLYQALVHNPGGLFDADMLADGTGNIRCTLPDPMTGVAANRTLGLIGAGTDGKAAFRSMGHNVSPRAFGHAGAAGQIAWADPDTGISFCFLTNGIELNFLREARRTSGIASRAALLTRPM